MKNKVKAIEEEKTKINDEYNKAVEENKALNKSVSEKDSTISELKEDIKTINKDKKNNDKEIVKLKKQIENTVEKNKLDELRVKLDKAIEEKSTLENSHNVAVQEMFNLKLTLSSNDKSMQHLNGEKIIK